MVANIPDPRRHGYNNKHAVMVVEWSWLKETTIAIVFKRETNSGLSCQSIVVC